MTSVASWNTTSTIFEGAVLMEDFKIMLQTIPVILFRKGGW
jgi:hypothetical protein